MTGAEAKAAIRAEAYAIGFDTVGFAKAEPGPDDAANLRRFLAEGRHGTMTWMEETETRRADPRALWPEARSVVVLGMSYAPDDDPLAVLNRPDEAAISVYARNRDYHDTMKKRLKRLGRWMAETFGCELKVFVDTAPVMESALAARSGVGWRGYHTNLVSRTFGSYLFLGEVFTTLDLPPDEPEADHCGSCRACVEACPTGALDRDGTIDARACVSYLTIEHAGPIPDQYKPAMGNRIYGCDDCTAACPWNKFAAPTPHADFQPRETLRGLRLADMLALDEAGFRALFTASPVKRIKIERFRRNALIAAGNSGEPGLDAVVARHRDDDDDGVRDAARWAATRPTATDGKG